MFSAFLSRPFDLSQTVRDAPDLCLVHSNSVRLSEAPDLCLVHSLSVKLSEAPDLCLVHSFLDHSSSVRLSDADLCLVHSCLEPFDPSETVRGALDLCVVHSI